MADGTIDRRRALSFGQAAEGYDRVRPSYPAQAVRWAVGEPPARVVDLGAGTGILTRVLRPGGVFAPVWNVRDESVEWVAELTRVAALSDGTHRAAPQVDDLGPLFGPVERVEFRHSATQTPESLLGLVRSRSYYLAATSQRRAELDAAVRDLARRIGRQTFELPYVTVAYRAIRLT